MNNREQRFLHQPSRKVSFGSPEEAVERAIAIARQLHPGFDNADEKTKDYLLKGMPLGLGPYNLSVEGSSVYVSATSLNDQEAASELNKILDEYEKS